MKDKYQKTIDYLKSLYNYNTFMINSHNKYPYSYDSKEDNIKYLDMINTICKNPNIHS